MKFNILSASLADAGVIGGRAARDADRRIKGTHADISAQDFAAGTVMNPNQSEIIGGSLYDFQLYPTAGQNQLNFFQNPIGQGVTTAVGAVVGSTKTVWDTNMALPGQLANGAAYLIRSIEVLFTPGSVSTANTYTPAVVGDFTAAATDAVYGPSNDVNTIYQSGLLELDVFNKNYVRETPLMMFPPAAMLSSESSQSSNAAATGTNIIQITSAKGRMYEVDPFITLKPAVNFVVKLSWPAAVATGSGFNGRIGVRLNGWFMRASQ